MFHAVSPDFNRLSKNYFTRLAEAFFNALKGGVVIPHMLVSKGREEGH
jgi:hypothetical protein